MMTTDDQSLRACSIAQSVPYVSVCLVGWGGGKDGAGWGGAGRGIHLYVMTTTMKAVPLVRSPGAGTGARGTQHAVFSHLCLKGESDSSQLGHSSAVSVGCLLCCVLRVATRPGVDEYTANETTR